MSVGIIFSFPDLSNHQYQEAWHDNMYSYKVLSELGNGSLESFADTRLVAIDGAKVRVHWSLLVARSVWWTRSADQDRVKDGDRVIIFNGVTIQELRKFVSDIYCDCPRYGWNPLDIAKPLKIVAEEDDDDCTVQWGASHQQAEAEAGKLPLGLVAAPAPLSEAELSVLTLAAAVSEAELTSPAVGASSDCVLADLAEGETKQLGHLVNSESVFEAEASPVSERGAGHQGPAKTETVPLGLVAAPAPGLSDNSDCVLAESAEVGTVPLAEEAAIQSEAGVTSPVPEWVSEKLFVNSIRRKEGI